MKEEIDKNEMVPGAVFEIPPEGSLGMLAVGAVAVKPWRQKRIESGFEAELIERSKKQAIEAARRKEERQKKIQEAQLKKEQEENEQKNG